MTTPEAALAADADQPAKWQPEGPCCHAPEECHGEQGCPNPRHPQFHVVHEYVPARATLTEDETGGSL